MKHPGKAAAQKYPYPEMKGLSAHTARSVRRDIDKYREGFTEGVNWQYDNTRMHALEFMEWTHEQGYDYVWSSSGERQMLWTKKYDQYITTKELYVKFKISQL